jgi:hypothetical protein
MDNLTTAVVDVASHAAAQGWQKPPSLYALVPNSAAESAGELIAFAQDPLPAGEPDEVLASIHWPETVAGCVLVTELIILPLEAEESAPADQHQAEQWAAHRPDKREGRLSVGVMRGGQYLCCLQLRGDDDLLVRNDLADDLVAALLNTL